MAQTPLIAVVARGLEDVAARELRALGGGIGKTRKDRGRVTFEGPPDALIRANLQLRTVDRILLPVGQPTEAKNAAALVRFASGLPWERWIPSGTPVAIAASARGCGLYHTGLVADALREALVSRGLSGEAPEGPSALTIDARGTGDLWTLALDTSGGALHRRGYRQDGGAAPLRETLAAALLLRIGWTGDVPLLDPMAGSGTIACEAGLIATGRAPGRLRSFAFQSFASHDPTAMQAVLDRLENDERPAPASIVASDLAASAVKAARSNVVRAGLEDAVSVVKRTLQETPRKEGPGVIVTNPPYGKRIGDAASAQGEWAAWGDALRAARPGWSIYALSPDRSLADAMGGGKPLLRFSNGGISVALVQIA